MQRGVYYAMSPGKLRTASHYTRPETAGTKESVVNILLEESILHFKTIVSTKAEENKNITTYIWMRLRCLVRYLLQLGTDRRLLFSKQSNFQEAS